MNQRYVNAYTDYPFAELGDTLGKKAPMRNCKVLYWDRDKYCHIEIDGISLPSIKRGYIYRVERNLNERQVKKLKSKAWNEPPVSKRSLASLPEIDWSKYE